MRYRPLREAERLELALGDPGLPSTVFSYAACAELDAGDEFPEAICRQLDEFGLPAYYVPDSYGGRLRSYETSLALMRMVARRDVTVAVAHGKTYLGAVSAWVTGDHEQATRLGSAILSGVPVSWALTEREHGSDLLAGEVTAELNFASAVSVLRDTRTPGTSAAGDRLSGEKWLINNATRGGILCVLARSKPSGGPRGFSLFLVDKRNGGYEHLPKVLTHGIRGADISGIELRGAVGNRLGADGAGLETVLKGLQLTRTLCSALSLGAGDHALSIATRFAAGRELYGHRLTELPAARHTLAVAYADHLLAEAFSVIGARSIQALPAEMSVLAAAAKYLVPTRTEAMIARLRRLVGARSLLRTSADTLGKVERDHRIVSLFDGNTLVNLNSLITLFPILLRSHDKGFTPDAGLDACANLAEPLPSTRLDRLSLVPRRGSSLLLALPSAVGELRGPVAATAELLLAAVNRLYEDIRTQPSVPVNVPTRSFVLAGRLAAAIAGAAAIQLWLHNHEKAGDSPLWRNGTWLHAALDRVLLALGTPSTTDFPTEALFTALTTQVHSGHLTSLFPCDLAEAVS